MTHSNPGCTSCGRSCARRSKRADFRPSLGMHTCSEREPPRTVRDDGSTSIIPVLSEAGRLLRAHTFAAGGFDRGFDRDNGLEPDKPTEAAAVGPGTVQGREHRATMETPTRGEAFASLRQAVKSGWERGPRVRAPRGELAAFRAGLERGTHRLGEGLLPSVPPGTANCASPVLPA
jgi:hypothetical protein